MNIIDFYQEARNLIAQEKFDQLSTLSVDKPAYFNWVVDVFEGMNLKNYGDSEALIWVNNTGEQKQGVICLSRGCISRGGLVINFLNRMPTF